MAPKSGPISPLQHLRAGGGHRFGPWLVCDVTRLDLWRTYCPPRAVHIYGHDLFCT
eukprot:CAMPEP_0114681096 /NCGR_PEP_ID=MMETSP0191-20121206/54984_1 /TAXON_ID=126664 /ORGANISM="Sorites sp." /LENGTH=55 /DNA_ID=CAMNT_0001958933 /DNA_START=209 /DNA_END=376 /DNA_ORIENTATION=+